MKRTIHKASLLTAMLLTAIFMAKANACTIVSGIDKNGQVWTANNEDGSPKNINFINVFPKTGDIRYGYFSLTYHSPDEITIQGGMNESGLTFDFNALSTFKVKDRARKQLFPCGDAAILPHILANMDTVEKVVAFFDKYWLSGDSASWQMHVADRHGHFAIIGPSGSIIFTDAPYLVSTNFNIVGKEDGSTCWRYPIATSKLKKAGAGLATMIDICKSTAQTKEAITLYSNVQNLTTGDVWFFSDSVFDKPFKSNIKTLLAQGKISYLIKDLHNASINAGEFGTVDLRKLSVKAEHAEPAKPSAINSSASVEEVDHYIKLRMERQHIPGLSLAVVKEGKVIFVKGYGHANLEHGALVTPNTVYQIGSLTKQFTAAAIMLLVQANKIRLDDKISKYLDATPPSWQDITLRHLLTHTSGLPNEGIPTTDKTFLADYTQEEMLQSARGLSLLSQPGEQFSYSNLGYNLLAMVIEKASGQTYANFVRERLFQPVGMTATKVNDRAAITPLRAQGYLWEGGKLRVCEQVSPTRYMGSASILSTARDMAKWDAALYSDAILTEASRKAMWAPMTLNNGKSTDYGFGWYISSIKNHTNINHNGAINGCLANISRFVDDKLTVIVLVNQSGLAATERIATGVARLYIPAIRPAPPPKQPAIVKIDPAVYGTYAGRYEFYNNVMLTLTPGKEMLSGHMPWGEADDYLPLSETSFWQAEDGVQLTVLKNAKGEVTGLRARHDHGWEHTAPRIGPLIHALVKQPDPDPTLTQKIEAILKAMGQSRKAVEQVPNIAPGRRKNISVPHDDLIGLRSLSFMAAEDVAGRGIERHGEKVSRVLYYQFATNRTIRYVLVFLTDAGLVADSDVVDD